MAREIMSEKDVGPMVRWTDAEFNLSPESTQGENVTWEGVKIFALSNDDKHYWKW